MNNKKQRGITLIALVVTIIILLILAGVTLNMALSGDGLFSRARNATDKYKKAQEDEAELISDIAKEMNSEYVGAEVTGYEYVSKEYSVLSSKSGADNNQTFKTEEDIGWRIWDYDGTILRIISSRPTEPIEGTTNKLILKGATGYNNSVNIINEICRQCYGQYELDGKTKKTGISVANLRRSDIEKISIYDYKNSIMEGRYFGEKKTYEENNFAPTIWIKYDSKWNYSYSKNQNMSTGNPECEDPWEQEFDTNEDFGNENTNKQTEFTQSYYYRSCLTEGNFKNSKYNDILFKKLDNGEFFESSYWLAGRNVALHDNYCDFNVNRVWFYEKDFGVGSFTVYQSTDTEFAPAYSLRPIVTIDLEKSGYNLQKIIDGDLISYKLIKKSE